MFSTSPLKNTLNCDILNFFGIIINEDNKFIFCYNRQKLLKLKNSLYGSLESRNQESLQGETYKNR